MIAIDPLWIVPALPGGATRSRPTPAPPPGPAPPSPVRPAQARFGGLMGWWRKHREARIAAEDRYYGLVNHLATRMGLPPIEVKDKEEPAMSDYGQEGHDLVTTAKVVTKAGVFSVSLVQAQETKRNGDFYVHTKRLAMLGPENERLVVDYWRLGLWGQWPQITYTAPGGKETVERAFNPTRSPRDRTLYHRLVQPLILAIQQAPGKERPELPCPPPLPPGAEEAAGDDEDWPPYNPYYPPPY